MPNWCANRVTVSGDEKDVQVFREAVKYYGEGKLLKWFSFYSINPMPNELHGIGSPVTIMTEEEIAEHVKKHAANEWTMSNLPITQKRSDELKEKYGADNWYDWCNDNWTSKWDACDVALDVDDSDYLCYKFETPWGPPEEIYNTLKMQHPNVSITWFYDEPGMEFAGYLGDKRGYDE